MELRFLRDTDKREVDFVVLKSKKLIFAVECKLSESSATPHMHYFAERTNIPIFYQVHLGRKETKKGKVHVLPFLNFSKDVLSL